MDSILKIIREVKIMKTAKIVALAAVVLMCTTLAACYQKADGPNTPATGEANALTADPKYAAPADPSQKDQEIIDNGKLSKSETTVPSEQNTSRNEDAKTVVDVQIGELPKEERREEAEAARKDQPTIGELVKWDIREVTLKTMNQTEEKYGSYTSQAVALDRWETFIQAVDQDVWAYHYCPGGNGLLKDPWESDYVLVLKDAQGREYALNFWSEGYITVLAVPEGTAYQTYAEEQSRSVTSPTLFAHYTVDKGFYAALLGIFTR